MWRFFSQNALKSCILAKESGCFGDIERGALGDEISGFFSQNALKSCICGKEAWVFWGRR